MSVVTAAATCMTTWSRFFGLITRYACISRRAAVHAADGVASVLLCRRRFDWRPTGICRTELLFKAAMFPVGGVYVVRELPCRRHVAPPSVRPDTCFDYATLLGVPRLPDQRWNTRPQVSQKLPTAAFTRKTIKTRSHLVYKIILWQTILLGKIWASMRANPRLLR